MDPDTAYDIAASNPHVIVQFAKAVWDLLTFNTTADDHKREAWMKAYLEKSANAYPDFNIAVCHVAHERSGKFVHQHYELPISIGRTIGYEIYFAPKGRPFKLIRHGDGGWINWGFVGDFTRSDNVIEAH